MGNNIFGSFKKDVPIVGQPFTMKGFFITVQVVCNCPDKEPVLLVGSGIGKCPACERMFQLQGVQPGPKGLQFQIGMVTETNPHAALAAANGGGNPS